MAEVRGHLGQIFNTRLDPRKKNYYKPLPNYIIYIAKIFASNAGKRKPAVSNLGCLHHSQLQCAAFSQSLGSVTSAQLKKPVSKD